MDLRCAPNLRLMLANCDDDVCVGIVARAEAPTGCFFPNVVVFLLLAAGMGDGDGVVKSMVS